MARGAALRVAVLALVTVGAVAQYQDAMWGSNPATCAASANMIAGDETIQNFVTRTRGCTRDNECLDGAAAFKAACSSLTKAHTSVCTTTYSYVPQGGGAPLKFHRLSCMSQDCSVDPSQMQFQAAVGLYEAKATRVSVTVDCNTKEPEWLEYIWVLDVVYQAFYMGVLISILVFAGMEKRRRWDAGMAHMWPASGTSGRFRTTLFQCCTTVHNGHGQLTASTCNSSCWKAACCPCAMASFNRAALDDRQWTWCDLLFSQYTLYYNRQTLRRRLDAKGDACMDCLTVLCCATCAVGQHTLEIQLGGLQALGQGMASQIVVGVAEQQMAPMATAGGVSTDDVKLGTAV